jgi:hypothetical protein
VLTERSVCGQTTRFGFLKVSHLQTWPRTIQTGFCYFEIDTRDFHKQNVSNKNYFCILMCQLWIRPTVNKPKHVCQIAYACERGIQNWVHRKFFRGFSLVKYLAVSLEKRSPKFWRTMICRCEKIPQDAGTTVLRSIENRLFSEAASYTRRTERLC